MKSLIAFMVAGVVTSVLILLTTAWFQKKLTEFFVLYYAWRVVRAKRNHKCLWRCYRDGGGGQLITPKPMTEERAVAWVGRVVNAEVYHVDFEHRMIFYRSTGRASL